MEAAPTQASMPATAPKQKMIAFLLAFFLGPLGVHNFYLGKTGMGVAQLILTITVIGRRCEPALGLRPDDHDHHGQDRRR